MQELIVKAITGGLKIINTTREALAADLEEIARKVRARELIADGAFDTAKQTRDDTKDARDKLPD